MYFPLLEWVSGNAKDAMFCFSFVSGVFAQWTRYTVLRCTVLRSYIRKRTNCEWHLRVDDATSAVRISNGYANLSVCPSDKSKSTSAMQ